MAGRYELADQWPTHRAGGSGDEHLHVVSSSPRPLRRRTPTACDTLEGCPDRERCPRCGRWCSPSRTGCSARSLTPRTWPRRRCCGSTAACGPGSTWSTPTPMRPPWRPDCRWTRPARPGAGARPMSAPGYPNPSCPTTPTPRIASRSRRQSPSRCLLCCSVSRRTSARSSCCARASATNTPRSPRSWKNRKPAAGRASPGPNGTSPPVTSGSIRPPSSVRRWPPPSSPPSAPAT